MTRRFLLAALLPAWGAVKALAASVPGLAVEGRLVQSPGQPTLELPGHKLVYLHGDDPTMLVLNDKRLSGVDLEAVGHFNSPDHFEIDPIHTKAMFVHKDGKRLLITYWCDVCYIRTYAPGACWCCQKNTDLDLVDSNEP